jgi:serine/threonine protein kinase
MFAKHQVEEAVETDQASDQSTSQPLPPAPGAAPSEVALAERIGATVGGRYTLTRQLVTGQSGDIFEAIDSAAVSGPSSANIALKIARGESAGDLGWESFRDEYNQARRLSHPNIARVYDFVSEEATLGYTLDLPPGEPLGELLMRSEGRGLSPGYCWAVISAIGGALAHAHMRDVVHGGLSPKNVWLTFDDQLKVLEFGSRPLPTAAEHDGAASPSVDGAAYASCHVLEGHAPRVADDLYSLACIAYELLSGRHPWGGSTAIGARALALRRLNKPRGIRSAQWRVLRQALSDPSAGGSSSVRDLLASLELVVQHDRLPPTVPNPPGRRPSSRRMWYTVAAVALLSGGLLWLGMGTRAPAPANVPIHVAPLEKVARSIAATPPVEPPVHHDAAAAAGPTIQAPVMAPEPSAPPPSAEPHHVAHKKAPLSFSEHRYRVTPASHFVEIQVLRNEIGKTASRFSWWTEPGTAMADTDFVPQPAAAQSIAPGAQSTSLFVRIPASRVSGRTFSVCVSRASQSPRPICVPVVL